MSEYLTKGRNFISRRWQRRKLGKILTTLGFTRSKLKEANNLDNSQLYYNSLNSHVTIENGARSYFVGSFWRRFLFNPAELVPYTGLRIRVSSGKGDPSIVKFDFRGTCSVIEEYVASTGGEAYVEVGNGHWGWRK